MPETDPGTRYVPGTSPSVLLFLLFWILSSSASPLLLTGGVVPLNLSPDGVVHQIVLAVQLSYLILALPLLLSGIGVLETERGEGGNAVDWYRLCRYLLFAFVLVVLGLPAFLIAGNIADAPVKYLFQGQLQLISLVFAIGLIWWGSGRNRRHWFPPLFVGLLVLSVMGPVIYAGLAQVGGVEYPLLLDVSPVVSVFRQETVMSVSPRVFHSLLAMGCGVIICAVLLMTRLYRSSSPDGTGQE